MKYSITFGDFLFLNQGVIQNCTNFFADECYCVEPVGPIQNYPGHPDYVPPITTVSEIPFDDPSSGNLCCSQDNRSPKEDMHSSSRWTSDVSECRKLVMTWKITLEKSQNWNPSFNISSEKCEMDVKYRYCMKAYDGIVLSPATGDQSIVPSGRTKPTKTTTSNTEGADVVETRP
ncbi:hypothetical protein FOYG_16058 [Fusarium oxysporum NRRL 32931]|uniref:LysM domain-containing protein n=1 Tax=Fusarium oxysporum NRRL 32931 TaxID=660029 RepID=W9HLR3_FUSOX|nr:hypothetical protein FOYG_16058 [Fusarium oxysporum NRRL 32931]